MGFEFGTVVLVPFPFTDQVGIKQRPAVVVSSLDYAEARPDIVIMAITSQLRLTLGFAELLVTDWRGAGLLKPSLVKPVFATIEQTLVRHVLGSLSDADEAELARLIPTILMHTAKVSAT